MRQIKLETPDTLWTTIYLGDALDALRTEGLDVSEEAVAHLTPAQHDHIKALRALSGW
jgi:Tn3 transposase DDE domain